MFFVFLGVRWEYSRIDFRCDDYHGIYLIDEYLKLMILIGDNLLGNAFICSSDSEGLSLMEYRHLSEVIDMRDLCHEPYVSRDPYQSTSRLTQGPGPKG